ncbi:DUF1542 domain-containing protein [Streptococcus pseudopneumoniae]|uniref:DUF1542 domain-containing protein n=3 Tax=Streptococcus pseudopneumoniae TaxID=257758 RepID=UPI0018B0378D|nr:DUF1542 domain-containing protein [Streptococcus pseudopneumoniae]MBF9660106.1 DUF1542 domain-containing protein [Streptococcus pseudopneumoniae]
MFYSEKDDREKQLRFSIRKVSFGAASVAVAALYLFMGSGAVSAEEAQAVQSNEEVAADKDSETEKKSEDPQLTYAAPAAKKQGSATNTEAGDEGKQESHPGTKEEEANSSERSETTTKTQSDENSVSGDSSSPKSEGEGTKSEEASSKPKVRKRRDAPSGPTATATDADPDANQTYEAPEDGASVDTLANKLQELPETVENEKKLANIDQVGATKSINPGEVSEVDEFGGWKAVAADGTAGKFAVAKKTDRGVFPIETVNTVRSSNGDTMHYWTWVKESVFDRSNNYALFLSKVRTQKNQNERTFDGTNYKTDSESNGISKGLKGFNGIEKTFKVYGQQVGSNVTIEFKTGYTGDIDGRKANYKVELKANKDGAEKILYTVTFDPSKNLTNENMTVTKATEDKNKQYFSTLRSHTETSTYNVELEKNVNRPQGIPGKFKSKLINIPQGYTDYTVSISSADNQHLGMGYQVPWQHYALPVTGEGFKVTQDTKEVAKDLSQKVYNKLTQQKEEDTKWSTPETQADYDVRLQKIKEKIDFGASTGDYKTVVRDALEKQRQLNEEQQIKDKAKDAVDAKLKEKEAEIDKNDKLSPAEKDKAKDAAKKAAEDAKQAITDAQTQDEVTKQETEGTKAIGDVNPIGTDMAVDAIAAAAARRMAEIEDDETLSEDEKTAAKEEVAEAVRKAGEAIRKAKQAKNQDDVDKAQADVISEVNAINPVGKDKATKAIEDKLKEKETEIDNNNKLSPREKEAAKKQAQAEADKAKQAITDAQTQDEVTKQETEGTKAIGDVNPIGTDMAVDAIAAAAARRMAEIEDDETLSEDEKTAAKEEVAEAVRKAGEAIKKAKDAKDQGGVDKAKEDALSEVTAVKLVAKDKAKADLEKAAQAEKAAIAADKSLTAAQRAEKEQAVEEARKAAEAKIDSAEDADKVAEAKTAGVTAIEGVHTNGDLEALKKAAKADLEKAAQAEKAAIAADKSLTAAQRAEKEQAVEEARKAAEAKIDSAEDADKVAEAKTAGVTAIEGVHTNGDLEALKKAAKADLAKKLADKLAAIDNTPNATKEEKDAAKDRAKQAADKAIQAIDAASDQAGVDKAQADGIAAVAAVNPVAKDKAKDKAKEAALPNTGSRSDSTTAALGLLSIFGAVGLLFSKKKKDDEEA